MRIIDADALREEILKHMPTGGSRGVFLSFVDDAPTIEAVPVHENGMQDFNNDLIRRTDALNMVHNFFLAKIKTVSGDREEIPMGELDPFLKDNKELSAKIKSIPNFEAVPVVHGEWVRDGDFWICLNCESEINVKNSLGEENRKNYCPNCGADMRKKV